MVELNLKQLVSQIRGELEDLDRERQAQGKSPLFELEKLELEVKFTVTENQAKKAGFDLKIVSAGTEGTHRQETVHTVKLQYRLSEDAGTGGRAHSSSGRWTR